MNRLRLPTLPCLLLMPRLLLMLRLRLPTLPRLLLMPLLRLLNQSNNCLRSKPDARWHCPRFWFIKCFPLISAVELYTPEMRGFICSLQ